MRLIDADKLPEHKFNRESAKSSDYMRGWNDAIDTIVDNAPTVELDESVIQSVLNKRCMTIVTNEHLRALYDIRPHGKWIEDNGTVACSHCHAIWLYRITDFCPNCGADMRKEMENEDCN